MIIVAIVVSVGLIVGLGMLIIYFQSPDDRTVAWLPKIAVLSGLFVACANVLLLPFDVTNAQTGGGLNLNIAWSISIYVTAIFLVVLLPYAYFYYENDTDPNEDTSCCCGLIPFWNGQCCEGVKWAAGFLIVFSIILVIMYELLSYADLPLTYRAYDFDSGQRVSSLSQISGVVLSCSSNTRCKEKSITINVQVALDVYILALLAFLGWFLFIIFAGVGLPALPFDLYNDWRYRPKPIPLDVYATEKRKIGERAALLKEAGQAIKDDELNSMGKKLARKERRELYETLHRFENAVSLLKKDFLHLQTAYKLRGGNPIVAWLKLFLSIIGGSISLMWLIHICVYMLPNPPAALFLNELFIKLTIPGFPLFGILAFTFYSFWLLLCVMKGNFRFGLRIPFCRVFPMEIGNTLMNSFLANTWLVLISSLVVVQFCAMAFPVYARDSTINLLFGTQIRYLRFFTYFFNNNVFIYCLLIFAILATIFLFVCPRSDSDRIEKELRGIIKNKDGITRRQLEQAAGYK